MADLYNCFPKNGHLSSQNEGKSTDAGPSILKGPSIKIHIQYGYYTGMAIPTRYGTTVHVYSTGS